MNKTDFIFIILGITFSLTCERRIDPEIIATVGSTFVTQDDFIVAYSKKLIHTSAQDSEFERNRTLNELIRTKLFAEAARIKNLSIDSLGINRIQLSKELALRQELYNHVIGKNSPSIDDSITRKHFQWQNTEVYLKHLYHNQKEILDTIVPMLIINPNDFDTYAKILFKNNALRDSGGDLGWVSYNTLDPHLEKVAFSIPMNEIVGPVRSSYGWHILLKTDERKQIIISEEDYQNAKKGLIQSIQKKYSQIAANDYVNNLVNSDITIDDPVVMNTLNQIHKIVFQKNKNIDAIEKQMSEKLTKYIIDLRLNSNTVLAKYGTEKFTINDLLHNLRNSNPKIFLDNPIQAFHIALRDNILTTEAINLGLEKKKHVQWKIQSSKDQYMAREFLLSVSNKKNNTNFSKKEIRELTEKLKDQFLITVNQENLNQIFKSN